MTQDRQKGVNCILDAAYTATVGRESSYPFLLQFNHPSPPRYYARGRWVVGGSLSPQENWISDESLGIPCCKRKLRRTE